MAKLIVLIGPQASGKSTYTKTLTDEVVVSSDEIRYKLQEEIHGDPYHYDRSLNGKVFGKYYAEIERNLLDDRVVVADATNVNLRERRRYFNVVNKVRKQGVDVHIHGILFLKDIETLVEHDSKRGERSVGRHEIIRTLKRFRLPNPRVEDWDSLEVIHHVDHDNMDEMWKMMDGFDQETKWHDLTLDKHTYDVMSKMPTKRLQEIALFHDVGKLYTKTYKDDGQAQYIGHAGVSSYIYLCEVKSLALEHIQNALVIERHMTDLHTWKKDKAISELGLEVYYMLHILEAADKPNLPTPIDLKARDYEAHFEDFKEWASAD